MGMPRQRLTSASFPGRLVLWFLTPWRIVVEIVVVIGFAVRIPCLPGRFKQRQLLFRQLLAFAVALRLQQFAQQVLIFLLFSERAIQLLGQIEHDLLQCLCILRQILRIDRPVPPA